MMRIGLALFRLNPPEDKQAGKERRHQLAQIRPDGGMCAKKSRIAKPVHAVDYPLPFTPWTTAVLSISVAEANPAFRIHCIASDVL